MNDAGNLLLTGTLTSPLIAIDDFGQLTLGNGATIVTGGIVRPVGITLTAPPPQSDNGAFLSGFTEFRQVGTSFVTGLGGGPSILVIDATGGRNIIFDPAGGLRGPNTWLVLSLTGTGRATGNVFVKSLDVLYSGQAAAVTCSARSMASPACSRQAPATSRRQGTRISASTVAPSAR